VLAALVIVATSLSGLMFVANQALKSSVETNRLRSAHMLLAQKVEEVAAGVEESGTSIEGYPGFSWDVSEQVLPIGETEESIRQVTVTIRYPTLASLDDDQLTVDAEELGTDEPGAVRATIWLDPEDAELQAPPGSGS
jgi:hypothetical protein